MQSGTSLFEQRATVFQHSEAEIAEANTFSFQVGHSDAPIQIALTVPIDVLTTNLTPTSFFRAHQSLITICQWRVARTARNYFSFATITSCELERGLSAQDPAQQMLHTRRFISISPHLSSRALSLNTSPKFCGLLRLQRTMTSSPQIASPTPRPSASLVVVNDCNEILLVHRNPKATSFGGMHVGLWLLVLWPRLGARP